MSSFDFVHWGGRSRLDNIEQELDALKRTGVLAPAVFSQSGTATTGVGALRFPVTQPATVAGVIATASTAPTGQALVFDVNKNGTTMFTTQSNRPQIGAGLQQTSQVFVPDVTAVATNDYISVDIDQIGSSVAGADLVVIVMFA